MDELELRRRCYAEPTDDDADFRAWLADNPAALETARKAAQFDKTLRFALNQPAAPEGLQGRILLNTAMHGRRRRQRRVFAGLALAASVVLSATLVLSPPPPVDELPVSQQALSHVYEEIAMLERADHVISQTELRGMFREMGGELHGELEHVRFAFLCPTPHGRGLHLIADTDAGRVTVLYLPQTEIDPQQLEFADARFSGYTMATNGAGTLNVIAESTAAVNVMRQQLTQSVSWPEPTRLTAHTQAPYTLHI
ncbi:hypothetical protein ATO7_05480 [Oceanococcus atlanticus]|uniref:Uncharacterized protein n=1 Tax=Oceanococcus atlanticus TaxID=1317117 RepID=A0A1Y1SI08_9GAMM|nr:DUF3379 family protein [Oceanococcus atlanticus]ORE89305.1 hypothetical protein ATO7_05480 [Oceanococcus atlanticus]